jgi:hypothetical protein
MSIALFGRKMLRRALFGRFFLFVGGVGGRERERERERELWEPNKMKWLNPLIMDFNTSLFFYLFLGIDFLYENIFGWNVERMEINGLKWWMKWVNWW